MFETIVCTCMIQPAWLVLPWWTSTVATANGVPGSWQCCFRRCLSFHRCWHTGSDQKPVQPASIVGWRWTDYLIEEGRCSRWPSQPRPASRPPWWRDRTMERETICYSTYLCNVSASAASPGRTRADRSSSSMHVTRLRNVPRLTFLNRTLQIL